MKNSNLVNKLYDDISKHGLINSIYATFGNKAKIKLGFTKDVCNTAIEEISLSVRGFNALKRNNINTLGELIDTLNNKEIMTLRNLGQKTAREINTKIIDYGYAKLSDKDKKGFLSDIIALNSI